MENINFCELSNEKLILLIDYLGHKNIIEKSDMTQIIRNDNIVEKKWSYYDELIVFPTEIYFIHETIGRTKIFDLEKYNKLQLIFKN